MRAEGPRSRQGSGGFAISSTVKYQAYVLCPAKASVEFRYFYANSEIKPSTNPSLGARTVFMFAAVNYGSCRIMERNGMRREALRVKAFWARVDKEWIDEAWYAILAEEYFNADRCVNSINY